MFGLTTADIQGWITSIGVFLTGAVALAGLVQGRLNARSLKHTRRETRADVAELSKGLTKIDAATNGMKKELEGHAYQAGVRSADGSKAANVVAEAAAAAANVVAAAAQTAADLRVVASQAAAELRSVADATAAASKLEHK